VAAQLHARFHEAKAFYHIIVGVTVVAVGLNFLGGLPDEGDGSVGYRAGSLDPPLLLLIMLMTNNRDIMGKRVNSPGMNLLGWITAGAVRRRLDWSLRG
jgi:Mn2+/Fe2+ NRAMP family transporter